MSWIAGLIATAATIGMSAAANARAAKASQVNLDNGEGARADAATLPARRAIEAAAQQGKQVTVPTGKMLEQGRNLSDIPAGTEVKVGNQWVKFDPAAFAAGGQYAGQAQTDKRTGQQFLLTRTPQNISADFTGMGEADINAKIADQMARAYLDIGDKYGGQFVEESRKQLEQADPEGTAARKELYNLTMEQAARKPERPVGDALEQRVNAAVLARNRLTDDAAANLNQASAGAGDARGQKLDATLLRRELERGSAGEARAAGNRQKALGFLTSGQTAEDVNYQREQQNMANLQNFVNGVTPTSQFSQVAGAQRGAAPLVSTSALPTISNNADQLGTQFGLQGWQARQAASSNTANSWFGALSSLLSAGSTVAAAGK